MQRVLQDIHDDVSGVIKAFEFSRWFHFQLVEVASAFVSANEGQPIYVKMICLHLNDFFVEIFALKSITLNRPRVHILVNFSVKIFLIRNFSTLL